jgi:preprotein translocase subunit SecD
MFTAITVTRTLLLLLVNSGVGRNLGAWGVNRTWQPRFNVVRNRYKYYLLSVLLIVPGLIFAFMGGFKPGIDFTGGTEVRLQFPTTVTRSAVENAIRKQGIEDPAAQIAGNNTVYVRLPRQKGGEVTQAQADTMVQALQQEFPGVTAPEYSLIGSSISSELTRNAVTSIFSRPCSSSCTLHSGSRSVVWPTGSSSGSPRSSRCFTMSSSSSGCSRYSATS